MTLSGTLLLSLLLLPLLLLKLLSSIPLHLQQNIFTYLFVFVRPLGAWFVSLPPPVKCLYFEYLTFVSLNGLHFELGCVIQDRPHVDSFF